MSVKEVVVGDLNTVKDRYHNWEKVGLIEGPKPVPLSAYPSASGTFVFCSSSSLPNGLGEIFVEICSYAFSESRANMFKYQPLVK